MKMNFENAPLQPMHKKIVVGGMMGLLSDGYILGSIGLALTLATQELALSSVWVGLIGASSLIGLMVGSLLAGPLADRIGRKVIFYITMIVFCLFSALQFFVTSPTELFILRFILGVAIGADYAVVVALTSEWSPTKYRASFLSSLLVFWAIGYSIAFICGSLFLSPVDGDWRLLLASGAILPAIAFIIRFGAPESPKWLLSKGKEALAQAHIQKYIGKEYAIFAPENEAKEKKVSWGMLFSPKYRMRTCVAGTFFACQVIPFFAISIFLPNILQAINIENQVVTGIIYNVFLIVGICIGTWIVDKLPRRVFLIYSFYICAIMLLFMTVWQGMPSLFALLCLSIFSLVISCAQVLEFVYPPELFPTELRASGVGFAVSMSRVGASIGTFLLPVVLDAWGTSAALAGCVLSLIIGGVVCQLYAPETNIKQ